VPAAFAADASADGRSADDFMADDAEPGVGSARALRAAVAGGAPDAAGTATGDGGAAGGGTSTSSSSADAMLEWVSPTPTTGVGLADDSSVGLADDSSVDGEDASGRRGSAGSRAESVRVTV
jgi:hypothetical protein